MDVVFTVTVNDASAHLTLSEAHGGERFDDSFIDLATVANPVDELVSTIVGTDRGLADVGHRLVGTRVVWSDYSRGNALCGALASAGVQGVAFDRGSQTATGLAPQVSGASFGNDSHAATGLAPQVSGASFGNDSQAATGLAPQVSGASFGNDGPSTALGPQIGSQLAYSQVPDDASGLGYATGGTPYDTGPAGYATGGTPYDTGPAGYATGGTPYAAGPTAYGTGPTAYDTGATAYASAYPSAPNSVPLDTPFAPLVAAGGFNGANPAARPRLLLVGSTLAGVAVVAMAAAAVSVAINVRPTSQEVAQEPDAVPVTYAPYVGAVPDTDGQSVVVVPPPPAELVPNPAPAVVYANNVVPSRDQGSGSLPQRRNAPVNLPDPRPQFDPGSQFNPNGGFPLPPPTNPFAGVDVAQIATQVTTGVVGGLEQLDRINRGPIFNPFDPFRNGRPPFGNQNNNNAPFGNQNNNNAPFSEPEQPEPEQPAVREPEQPEPEQPAVREPEQPEPEQPAVREPEQPEPEQPAVR